jgi:ABC-2 type transport system ATP-binding protein
VLRLQAPLAALPPELADKSLTLAEDGLSLTYAFDARSEARTGVSQLLQQLNALGIFFVDLDTVESSLEDIFVELVRGQA